MERIEHTTREIELHPLKDPGLVVPWSVEYLFDVITKEGEKKRIKKLWLDPIRLGVYIAPSRVKRAMSPLEKTVERKNPLFDEYLNWLKENHGADSLYKKDLEMLENAAAITVTATYRRRIFEGLPYTNIHHVIQKIKAHISGACID